MIIGIASPVDVYEFRNFFPESYRSILGDLANPNSAPAVNTLVCSFLKQGHRIHLYTLGPKDIHLSGPQIELYVIAQESRYPINYLWGCFNNAAKIADCISHDVDSLDVLHAHWSYEYAYAAKEFTSAVPVLCTIRDWAPLIFHFESTKNKITWIFKRIMCRKVYADPNIHFVANSPYTAELVARYKGIEAKTIPNSVSDTFFDKVNRVIYPGLRIVSIASSYDKRKNIKTLLEAFKLVHKEVPDATLHLIGKPFKNSNPALKELFDAGLIGTNVYLLGEIKHNELKGYLDNATVFVSSSLEETFGNTFLEAISRKVPAIGGESSGAVPYVLHNGAAGYLCDVNNPDSIKEAILKVYYNPDEAKGKAEDALEIIRNEYSESVVCKQYLELYEELTKK